MISVEWYVWKAVEIQLNCPPQVNAWAVGISCIAVAAVFFALASRQPFFQGNIHI